MGGEGCGVWGVGCRVQGIGCRVYDLGLGVQGLGLRVYVSRGGHAEVTRKSRGGALPGSFSVPGGRHWDFRAFWERSCRPHEVIKANIIKWTFRGFMWHGYCP